MFHHHQHTFVRVFTHRFLLLLLAGFLICLQRQSALAEKPQKTRHYIFLIHGIGGNKTHFGHMEQALSRLLNKQQDTRYVISNFEYDTGNHQKSVYDFAQDFAAYSNAFLLAQEKITPADKVSLIMHSQGGLVGSIWMIKSLQNDAHYSPKLINNLDSFITLATPFWGAKTAQFADRINRNLQKLHIQLPLPMGRKQLHDMSFGSDNNFRFRQAFLGPQGKRLRARLSKIRLLNVAAIAPELDVLSPLVSGDEKYEDDSAVLLPSARASFIAHSSIIAKPETMTKLTPQKIDIAPFTMVKALHLAPETYTGLLAGIAQIPKTCVSNPKCQHPSFSIITNHLQKRINKTPQPIAPSYTSFLLDINVRTPPALGISPAKCSIQFRQPNGQDLSSKLIEIANSMELESSGQNRSETYLGHLRFYFTGNIKSSTKTQQISMLLACQKLQSRNLILTVEKTTSSFVDVNLLPSTAR